MKRIAALLRAFFAFLFAISNDLLVLSGVSVVIWTNFRVNELLGWYSLGVALILAGIGLTAMLRKRNSK